MRQHLLMVVLVFSCYCVTAQTTIYARFIDYNSNVLKTDGSTASGSLITSTTIDPASTEFFRVTTSSQGAWQTLNIGSQSTGAGAGKVSFDSVLLSRPVDAASPIFFKLLASGTPYRTVELFYTDTNGRIGAKQLYKLVAFKSIRWVAASCTNDCPLVIENFSLQYGGLIETVYKSGATYLTTPVSGGWNRVQNVSDNDPNAIIK